MAVYIAHASIDENGRVKNGNAGDQTGKEVCIRTMYYKPWNQFFHIENDAVRTRFGNNMIDIAKNNNIGYDQNQRNTLLTQAKKVNFDFTKIANKCETDCSAVITTALLGAIYTVLGNTAYESAYKVLVVNGNCATTSTLKARLTKLTVIKVHYYTSRAYVSSTAKAVFGDIYNKSGSHVVCYIADGNKRGGKDTTILEWQKAAIADGLSFPKYGADGEWGSECEFVASVAIVKKRSSWTYQNLTKIVQKAVGVKADGKCGENTREAIIAYQKKNGLTADGCVGLNTWKKILGI